MGECDFIFDSLQKTFDKKFDKNKTNYQSQVQAINNYYQDINK